MWGLLYMGVRGAERPGRLRNKLPLGVFMGRSGSATDGLYSDRE